MALSDQEQLVDYYFAKVIGLLEAVARELRELNGKEAHGFRVRGTLQRLGYADPAEWKAGQALILARLAAAPDGMTSEELKAVLLKNNLKRIADGITHASRGRKNPLVELAKAEACIRRKTGTKYIYYDRAVFLTKHLGLPDDVQANEVKKKIAVDRS